MSTGKLELSSYSVGMFINWDSTFHRESTVNSLIGSLVKQISHKIFIPIYVLFIRCLTSESEFSDEVTSSRYEWEQNYISDWIFRYHMTR